MGWETFVRSNLLNNGVGIFDVTLEELVRYKNEDILLLRIENTKLGDLFVPFGDFSFCTFQIRYLMNIDDNIEYFFNKLWFYSTELINETSYSDVNKYIYRDVSEEKKINLSDVKKYHNQCVDIRNKGWKNWINTIGVELSVETIITAWFNTCIKNDYQKLIVKLLEKCKEEGINMSVINIIERLYNICDKYKNLGIKSVLRRYFEENIKFC